MKGIAYNQHRFDQAMEGCTITLDGRTKLKPLAYAQNSYPMEPDGPTHDNEIARACPLRTDPYPLRD